MPWAKLPDGSAVRAEEAARLFVVQHEDDNKWYVHAWLTSGNEVPVTVGASTQGAAQTRLDQIIAATGGTL